MCGSPCQVLRDSDLPVLGFVTSPVACVIDCYGVSTSTAEKIGCGVYSLDLDCAAFCDETAANGDYCDVLFSPSL